MNDLLAKDETNHSNGDSFLDMNMNYMTQGKGEEYLEEENHRVLFQKSELRGHGGAVYTTKFSPCGRVLASGSLDCRVLLWDVTTKFNQQQLASLGQHSQLVIDVRS